MRNHKNFIATVVWDIPSVSSLTVTSAATLVSSPGLLVQSPLTWKAVYFDEGDIIMMQNKSFAVTPTEACGPGRAVGVSTWTWILGLVCQILGLIIRLLCWPHQQTGVKLLGLIFFSSNYWQLLAIIGYYHDWYYWFAKSITIIGYYWTTPISLIIGINRNLLLRLIFLDTNYCN